MKRIFAIAIAMMILTSACFADEARDVASAVPDSVKETVGSIDNLTDTESFLKRLLSSAKDGVNEGLAGVIKKVLAIASVAVVCAVAQAFAGDEMPKYIPLAAAGAIAAVCVSDFGSFISLGVNAANDISLFSKTLLPAMCSLSAACGSLSSAALKYAASAFVMDLYIAAAQKLMIPLIYAYLAVTLAGCAFSDKTLMSISSLIKTACRGAMTLITLAFTLYIAVSGAVAKSGDMVAVKAAKTAIGSFLPIVGGIISDAASSVVAGAELLKNTVGAFGLTAVLAICISPLAVMFINFLGLKAGELFVNAFDVKPLSQLVGGIAAAFSMLMGLVGTCGLIMFISLISCIRTVTG